MKNIEPEEEEIFEEYSKTHPPTKETSEGNMREIMQIVHTRE